MNCYIGKEIDDSYNNRIEHNSNFIIQRENGKGCWTIQFTDVVLISDNKVDNVYEIY
jgi:hypothetical protein